MTTNQHGGPRPAIRPDDKRHNNKHGSPGRKPKSFTLKLGDRFYKSQQDNEGNAILPGELWTVTEIARNHVTISSDNGDAYRLLR